ncbi:hypothetical protein BXZ70DRAFT_465471 [Cristinia sonorae]|uniref:Uncharacterized protein n=1 Tax=Cristinia sonorae TaxID=1940300 RepID=A0A8K0UHM1_9AGAR|nr:hypothetical protein BXZ70DRAFT_465471 [Cristinia sonorae]
MSSSGAGFSDFIRGLYIPMIVSQPSLLLFELGFPSFKWDVELKSQLENEDPGPRMFHDASGRGKTRSLLELLCLHWGFYLAFSDSDGIGSGDLHLVLKVLAHAKWFTASPERKERMPADDAYRINEAVTSQRMFAILLSRVKIFKCFLEMLQPIDFPRPDRFEVPVAEAKRLWTLMQVAPTHFLGGDAFMSMSSNLMSVDTSDLLDEIEKTATWIETHLPDDNKHGSTIFMVLDEAQLAATEWGYSFISQDKQPRPVLRQVVSAIQDTKFSEYRLVISGTSLSEKAIRDAISSIILSGAALSEATQHADFINITDQLQYVVQFVPPGFLQSPSGQYLSIRLQRWPRGRFRLTAGFMQDLLADGLHRPHRVLTAYITHLAGSWPTDCHSVYEAAEKPDTAVAIRTHIFDFTHIDPLPKDHPVIRFIYKCVCTFLLGEEMPTDAPPELVTTSFAKVLGGGLATIRENLPLLALARWLKEKHEHNFATYLAEKLSDQYSRPFAFETIIPLYLISVVNEETPLNELFTFVGPEPEWASSGARMVACHAGRVPSEDSRQPIPDEVAINAETGVRLGRRTKDVDATMSWMQDPAGSVFLLPDRLCKPDCFALAQLSNGKYVWIVMQMKCHDKATLSSTDCTAAVKTVTPRFFYDTIPTWRNDLLQRLMHWAECDEDSFEVLRVVAAYPAAAEITKDPFPTPRNGKEAHPLALLNIDKLLANDPSNYLRAIAMNPLHSVVTNSGSSKSSS